MYCRGLKEQKLAWKTLCGLNFPSDLKIFYKLAPGCLHVSYTDHSTYPNVTFTTTTILKLLLFLFQQN